MQIVPSRTLLLLTVFIELFSGGTAALAQTLEDLLPSPADRSFTVKERAADEIAASGDPRALKVLKTLR